MHREIPESVWHSSSPFLLQLARRNLSLLVFLLASALSMTIVYWYFSPDRGGVEAAAVAGLNAESTLLDPSALSAPIVKPVERPSVTQRMNQSARPLRVGIIAGHRGNDSGAVCADGLTEVQLTTAFAEKMAAQLAQLGVPSDVLDEFDPLLQDYSASALVSIHVDSCDYINELATGFKISGSSLTDSTDLSLCLQRSYAEATGLPYHPNSITPHMSNYHAFREVSPGTPAVIIEVGFLFVDRDILLRADSPVSEGLVDGILCFLGVEP